MADQSTSNIDAKNVQLVLTAEQKSQIEKAFGPEMAKKVQSLMIAQAGAGLQSMVFMN
ncbi:MAG: hypothetical protein K2X57_11565 [Xanthobacteraceae bacterium]|nr:hypothetical protein [Xanthobacteraceae bacterium]